MAFRTSTRINVRAMNESTGSDVRIGQSTNPFARGYAREVR